MTLTQSETVYRTEYVGMCCHALRCHYVAGDVRASDLNGSCRQLYLLEEIPDGGRVEISRFGGRSASEEECCVKGLNTVRAYQGSKVGGILPYGNGYHFEVLKVIGAAYCTGAVPS
jgi:hypothetical protein